MISAAGSSSKHFCGEEQDSKRSFDSLLPAAWLLNKTLSFEKSWRLKSLRPPIVSVARAARATSKLELLSDCAHQVFFFLAICEPKAIANSSKKIKTSDLADFSCLFTYVNKFELRKVWARSKTRRPSEQTEKKRATVRQTISTRLSILVRLVVASRT